ALSRCLARFRVLSVEQDRAGSAVADSATKLRTVHSQHVAQNPQQRRPRVAVRNLDVRTIDGQLHEGRPKVRRDHDEAASPDPDDWWPAVVARIAPGQRDDRAVLPTPALPEYTTTRMPSDTRARPAWIGAVRSHR